MPKLDRRTSFTSTSTAKPQINKFRDDWLAKDDKILVQARAQGLNWNQISAKHFPTKSANLCRKRHEGLTLAEDDLIAQAYMEARRDMWSILAARVGEKWTLVEQKCMEQGLSALEKAFRKAQTKAPKLDLDLNDSGYSDHMDMGVEPAQVHARHSPVFSARMSNTKRIDPSSFRDELLNRYNPAPTAQADSAGTTTDERESLLSEVCCSSQTTFPDIHANHVVSTSKGHEKSASFERGDCRYSPSPDILRSEETSSGSGFSGDETVDMTKELLAGSDNLCIDHLHAQKEEILTRLMVLFYEVFASTGFTSHIGGSRPSPPNGSRQVVSTSGRNGKSNGRKRKTVDRDDDNQGEEDEGNPEKRRQLLVTPTPKNSGSGKRLACPYYKHNPHAQLPSRACSGPGWPSVHRLKEHLYREHAILPYCRRCHATFNHEAQLTEHLRSEESCVTTDASPPEGFDKDQEKNLKSRSKMFRADSEEKKWKIVYLILFPDTASHALPSPYYGNDTETLNEASEDHSPKAPELKQFDAYMSRELPRKVRKALETTMESLIGPIEETLKNHLENIVRDCQEALTRSFLDNIQSMASSSAAVAHGRQPGFISDVDRYSATIAADPTSDVFSQVALPPESLPEPWPELQSGPSAPYADSTYFSQFDASNQPFLSGTWAQIEAASGHVIEECMATDHQMGHVVVLESDTPASYTGKGKGKAMDHPFCVDRDI